MTEEKSATKIFMGHTFDVNIAADQLQYKSQGEISRTWTKMRATEFIRRKIYWFFVISTLAMVFAAVFINLLFIAGLVFCYWMMVHWHLEYLKAWSGRIKYDKRIYTRMDPQ
ncbi:MAG: hypothetical protein ABIA76_01265 [Candidatus Diapherotrites archaeon]